MVARNDYNELKKFLITEQKGVAIKERHILPYIGDVKLVDLTSGKIEQWIESLRNQDIPFTMDGKMKEGTIRNTLSVLSGCLRDAQKRGMIQDNPCVKVADVITGRAEAAESPEQALKDLYAGMDLAADSIPVAIALFVLGKGDVKLVNEYCVNFGGDCDTNAAMAGAMAGACSGIATVPKEWVETINKVNNIDLSVYVPQLIELAKDWTVAQV